MKKILVLTLYGLIASAIFILPGSCKHEYINPCSVYPVKIVLTKTDASPDKADGIIKASVIGGTGLTFSLNGGMFQSDSVFKGLGALKNYRVVVMNSAGCSDSAEIDVNTNDPCNGIPLSLTVTKTDASAGKPDGTITASATGGGGFSYSLNSGAFQSSGNFTGLAAGSYNITAKNSAGCTGSTTITVGVADVCAGVTIAVTLTKTDPTSGANGSITASATGTTGFTYSINGGAYQSSNVFSSLAAGSYTVTAKSTAGCTGSATITLAQSNACSGVSIAVSLTKTDPTSGSNGSITATGSGATGLTYSVNGGAYQSSGSFTGLAAGSYTVTAKSTAGCTGTATITLAQPNACAGVTIAVSLTKTDPTSGANGSITATGSGATGLTYSLNGGAYQSSGSFTGLAAGSYTVSAKSTAGCTGSATITLTLVNACASVSITISTAIVNIVPCGSTANNGGITVTASGSSGLTYNINGGAYQSGNVFSSLAAGAYTIGVKDANGCTNTASATVGTAAAGPQYAAVKTLLQSQCAGSGCHTNGGSSGGYNFDTDCNIISAYSKIQSAAVTNGNMPPSGPLSATDKQTITNWINGGHGYSN